VAGPASAVQRAGRPGSADAAAAVIEPNAGQGVAEPGMRDDVAVIVLVDLQPAARWWGWQRIARGAAALRGVGGLRFAKVMGSGAGGGFGLKPSPTHQGLFALFDGEAAADDFVQHSPWMAGWRERARECCVLQLRAWSSRGRWSGQDLRSSIDPPASGPVVALTRASIRPQVAARFWRMAPAAQADLAAASGCRLAAGMGEAPLVRQATVSLWDSVAAMDAYARSGAHQAAIEAARQQRFFTESMFVRFVPLRVQGRWQGQDHG
jgi:heme-degrading monooxygenase HmoA